MYGFWIWQSLDQRPKIVNSQGEIFRHLERLHLIMLEMFFLKYLTPTLKVHITQSESDVSQSCLTLYDPMYYIPPGSSVQGIFQARILEWVAISFSRRSSQPRSRNPLLPHCRQTVYYLSYQGSKQNKNLTQFTPWYIKEKMPIILVVNKDRQENMPLTLFSHMLFTFSTFLNLEKRKLILRNQRRNKYLAFFQICGINEGFLEILM